MDKGVRKDEKREGARKEGGRKEEGRQAGETGRGQEGKTQRKLEEKMYLLYLNCGFFLSLIICLIETNKINN